MIARVLFGCALLGLTVSCDDLRRPGAGAPAVARRIAELRAQLGERDGDPKLHVDLGDAYGEAKNKLQAAEHYLRAVELGTKEGRVFGALADLYLQMGYGPSAVAQLRKCMELNRGEPECLLALGLLFESDPTRQMQSEARRVYRQMLVVAPDHPRAAYVRSRIDQLTAKLGPEVEAPAGTGPHGMTPEEAEASRANPHAPVNPHGGSLANPHGASPGTPANPHGAPAEPDPHAQIPGHEAGAEAEVGELNEFGAAIQKAYAATRNNDAPGAEAAFREALKMRPTDATALAGLAQALLTQGKAAEALTTAEAASKSDPEDSQAQYTLGLALIRARRSMADIQRAVTTWEALIQADPEYANRIGLPADLDQIKRALKQTTVHPSGAGPE